MGSPVDGRAPRSHLPSMSRPADPPALDREARRAAQLRANLRRRKAAPAEPVRPASHQPQGEGEGGPSGHDGTGAAED
jgi:hypothetical protein